MVTTCPSTICGENHFYYFFNSDSYFLSVQQISNNDDATQLERNQRIHRLFKTDCYAGCFAFSVHSHLALNLFKYVYALREIKTLRGLMAHLSFHIIINDINILSSAKFGEIPFQIDRIF